MRKRIAVYILIVLLLLCFMFWLATATHGVVRLGNGYEYWNSQSGVIIDCVSSPNETTKRLRRIADRAIHNHTTFRGLPKIGPNVDGYRVYSKVIAGHVSGAKARNAFGDPIPTPDIQRTGYFVIDVHNDIIYDGLNKRKWLSRLRSFGINRRPELYAPSVLCDRILRRNRPAK